MVTRKQPRKKPATCQCRDANGLPCTSYTVTNSLFCQQHQNCPMSPLSGYEPRYQPEKYNNDPSIYKSHNCYTYSMNVMDPSSISQCRKNQGKNCRGFFHQPGALHGDRYALNVENRRTCAVVEKLMKSDVPEITNTTFEAKCPSGSSKIALVVDKGEDYHFYRQDADGMWSHKDGSNKVKRYDALKRPIFNPQTASRDYRWQGSDLNYEDFCGFYSVPRQTTVRLGQGGVRASGGSHGRGKRATQRLSVAGLSWRDHHRRASSRKTRKARKTTQ
jgi:hypothetical protein